MSSYLCIMQANGNMYARDITIYCPFLVVNKTHMALRVIDTAPLAGTPSIAPPLPEDNIAQPLLFRYCMRQCHRQRSAFRFQYPASLSTPVSEACE